MKVEWDYTSLARPYLKRPDYSPEALDQMFKISHLKQGDLACDVGAGVAHLTIPLLKYGLNVIAVEPNDAMRELGIERTKEWSTIQWKEGTGEETGQKDNNFNIVTFGSSFNVTDRAIALQEANRILKGKGYFACMWNLRDLEDPLQKEIEDLIKSYATDYNYGARREDQSDVIVKSGLFGAPEYIEGRVQHQVDTADWVEAWRSHATVSRQVGDKLDEVVSEIAKIVKDQGKTLTIPYVTKIWVSQKIADHV